MTLRIIFALALLVLSGVVHAEGNCPSGYYPIGGGGASGCAPIPNAGGGGSGNGPTGYWSTRWGAISIDDTVNEGGIGTVTGMTSKRKAERAALAQCRATGGGKECRISLSYHNQCAVIAAGDNLLKTWGGPTVEVASEKALAACKAKTTNCTIYYSGCSRAAWVQ